MIKQAKKISSIFFYLFFACLPFQISALLFSEGIYSSGFFNPYLSHFVYLADIFLLLGLLFLAPWFFKECKIGFKKIGYAFLVFFLASCLSLFLTSNLFSSLFYIFRFLEFFVVYLVIVNGFVDIKNLAKLFIYVMFFEALIGIGQYVLQESLGLRFFGEPVISSAEVGVAKVGLFDKSILRIYGTFPHPNIFAAYLLTAIFFAFNFVKRSLFFKAIILLLLLALFLTFSRSGLFAFIFSLMFYMWFYHGKFSFKSIFYFLGLISLLLFILGFGRVFLERFALNDVAMMQRYFYLDIAFEMIKSHPFGLGVGDFTATMHDYSEIKILPWVFQPVHNIYLLVFAESGVFAFLSLIYLFVVVFNGLFKKLKSLKGDFSKNMTLSILAILMSFSFIGFFDHYLISLYQGQMLFATVLGFAGFYLKRA